MDFEAMPPQAYIPVVIGLHYSEIERYKQWG